MHLPWALKAASPKSMSLQISRRGGNCLADKRTRQFSTFMSRCVIPREWRNSSALSTQSKVSAASSFDSLLSGGDHKRFCACLEDVKHLNNVFAVLI